jgi:hypothetical protein
MYIPIRTTIPSLLTSELSSPRLRVRHTFTLIVFTAHHTNHIHHGSQQEKGIEKHKHARSAIHVALQSPIHLPLLNTPYTSSITFSSPKFLPPTAAFDSLTLGSSSALPRTTKAASMDSNFNLHYEGDHFLDGPPDDLHSKRLIETPRYSSINAMTNILNAFIASKKLQQVFGITETPPEPYVRPPSMPEDLEERFVASLREYGVDVKMPAGNSLEMLRGVNKRLKKVGVGNALGKAVLEMIKEENESPVRATHMKIGGGLTINLPVWNSGCEAVSGTGYAVSSEEGSVNGYAGNNNWSDQQVDIPPANRPSTASGSHNTSAANYDENWLGYDPSAGSNSPTALTGHQVSHPYSSSVADTHTALDRPHAAQVASYTPTSHYADHDWIGVGYKPPRRSSSLVNLGQQSPVFHDDVYTRAQTSYEAPERIDSIPPVLFPPPAVEQEESWDFVQTDTGEMTPLDFALGGFAPDAEDGRTHYPVRSSSKPQDVPAPQIMVQAPSPNKLPPPTTKKRRATSQGAPTAKARASDNTFGLPTLPADLEMLWKFKFPGNTYALLTIILPWSLSMRRLYNALPVTKPFSLNAAFPYLVLPPLYQKLVSISFYDTSVTPHKEIRFIGPNDCAEMSYNEVDIFAYPDEGPIQSNEQGKANAMKRALGMYVGDGKNYRHMPMSQRADTGEGRWSYVLFQGQHQPSELAPPHMIIAWPTYSITNSSECLHTIYPDTSLRPSAPKRPSSLQNMAASMRLQQSLRVASSEHLPKVGLGALREIEGALTLKRRVLKMEKAGRVPLVEGYRVDVRKWEEWMKAVGRGKGKVMLWMER